MTPLTNRDMARDAHGHGCYAIDADGHVQAFNASIRDALIARGVLYRDADDLWHLRWSGFDLKRERAAWMAVCDFCSGRPVTWTLECGRFVLPQRGLPPFISNGDWAACETCAGLVQHGRPVELVARMCAGIAADAAPAVRAALERIRRELAEAFWRHYTGRAVRETPHPFGH